MPDASHIESQIAKPSIRLVKGSTTGDFPVLEIKTTEVDDVVARIYDERGGPNDYIIDILDPGDINKTPLLHHIQIPNTQYTSPANQPWAMTADLPRDMTRGTMKELIVDHMDPRRNKLKWYDTAGSDQKRLNTAVNGIKSEFDRFDKQRLEAPAKPKQADFDDLSGALQEVLNTTTLVKFDSTSDGVRPQEA